MSLMYFAGHLNSLLLIFCFLASFCSYLKLISKKIHLIKKFVAFKGC